MDDPSAVDTTHLIFSYENGKTWECPECGLGDGTAHEKRFNPCHQCGSLLVDEDADSRQPISHERDENGELVNPPYEHPENGETLSTQTTLGETSKSDKPNEPEIMDPLDF